MGDSDTKLTRRRVLGGLITVGAASAAAGAGTFALFSDSESSDGNTIQAGTLDLGSTSGESFSFSNISPGWGPETETITTSYSASDGINSDIKLGISLEENDSSTTTENGSELTAGEFAEKIEVKKAEITDGSNTTTLDGDSSTHKLDGGDVDYYDLDQLASDYTQSDNQLTSVSPGSDVELTLKLAMPTEVGNDAQGQGIDIDITFEAEQA